MKSKPQIKASDVNNDHVTRAGQPVDYMTSGHPKRTDSPQYVKTRVALHKIFGTIEGWPFGAEPIQDHHGGGMWAFDDQGWFFVKNLLGIEWSGQFCADPKKIDELRVNAKRFFAGFPKSFAEYKTLGIDLKELLETPITDANGVANWTDSICNASVPLPQPAHTGTVPKGGGVHNYPTPVTDIAFFKHDDFNLWVKDGQGNDAAVVPAHPRGSHKSDVRVVHSEPGSTLHKEHMAARAKQQFLELPGTDPMAKQAFAKQQ